MLKYIKSITRNKLILSKEMNNNGGMMMRIITVSREFGSGGRELGKRLAELLDFDYYDNEIISAIAKNSGLNEKYVENALTDHGWKNYPVTFHSTFGSAPYVKNGRIELLVEQKKVIEQIASLNKDFVIVGRNADVILSQYAPFNIFVCASMQAKINRCAQRAGEDEHLTEKEIIKKINQIDKSRSQTRAIMCDSPWGERTAYHLTVNTTDFSIKDAASAVADFAEKYFEKNT